MNRPDGYTVRAASLIAVEIVLSLLVLWYFQM